ncbi:MAG: efflux RND transporter periplasmic adaptor subunit [Planctomycetota bacterium]
MSRIATFVRRALGSALLLAVVAGVAFGLMVYKRGAEEAAVAAAAAMPEPAEAVEAARVVTRDYTRQSTAIGTVRALRSITLRNELPGTVREVRLTTGQIVARDDLLVELDVAVEQAQLAAQRAEARLGESMLGRMERASESQGASAADVDRARAERDMAAANVQRLEALIERKRLRAPFRARVGFVDLHVGQYLDPGTSITTLQGLDDAVHVDFPVTQEVSAHLAAGASIEVVVGQGAAPVVAKVVALDARADTETRSTMVRAELRGVEPLPRPGSSVRVRVPVGPAQRVAVVPVSALRRGPSGNTVFVLQEVEGGQLRAIQRQVDSGAVLGDEVVITAGLDPGDTVAAAGSFKLFEGALVIAAPPAPTAAPADAPEAAGEAVRPH